MTQDQALSRIERAALRWAARAQCERAVARAQYAATLWLKTNDRFHLDRLNDNLRQRDAYALAGELAR